MCCRFILDQSGAGWVAAAHANNRGSHRSYDIRALFSNCSRGDIAGTVLYCTVLYCSRGDIAGVIARFYMDFRICGYEDSLREMQMLLTGNDQ